MKIWKRYKLNHEQFGANLILSIVLVLVVGILIGIYFGGPVFFKEPLPTLLYYVSSFVIFYQIGPAIVKRMIKDR